MNSTDALSSFAPLVRLVQACVSATCAVDDVACLDACVLDASNATYVCTNTTVVDDSPLLPLAASIPLTSLTWLTSLPLGTMALLSLLTS